MNTRHIQYPYYKLEKGRDHVSIQDDIVAMLVVYYQGLSFTNQKAFCCYQSIRDKDFHHQEISQTLKSLVVTCYKERIISQGEYQTTIAVLNGVEDPIKELRKLICKSKAYWDKYDEQCNWDILTYVNNETEMRAEFDFYRRQYHKKNPSEQPEIILIDEE